jgi:methylmalonyl-CoA mutase N-terminal domain/subunit
LGREAGLMSIDRSADVFFFNAHNDSSKKLLISSCAADLGSRMKSRFGSQYERTLQLRFHTRQLASRSPCNNPEQYCASCHSALAGVLAAQSLHTDAYDEALALLTDRAALIAPARSRSSPRKLASLTLSTHWAAHYIESLTEKMEQEALDYFRKIDAMGGMVAAIEKGFPQREIHDSAYHYQKAVERGDRYCHEQVCDDR